MRVLLTGGSGDLGTALSAALSARGDKPVNLDVRRAPDSPAEFLEGSILDRQLVAKAVKDVDTVVHIAAWHGIHEFRKEKDAFEFWDLNVTGTVNVVESCVRAGVKKLVFVSSTSVDDWPGVYAHSKLLCEDLMRTYMNRHEMSILSLRPRAFIPHWSPVYATFADWAKWYWKGAVHVGDVNQATVKAIDALATPRTAHAALTIDGACEFTDDELYAWDKDGAGTTFKKRFGEDAHGLFVKHGLDPARMPKILRSTAAQNVIGYKADYGFAALIKNLQEFDTAGSVKR